MIAKIEFNGQFDSLYRHYGDPTRVSPYFYYSAPRMAIFCVVSKGPAQSSSSFVIWRHDCKDTFTTGKNLIIFSQKNVRLYSAIISNWISVQTGFTNRTRNTQRSIHSYVLDHSKSEQKNGNQPRSFYLKRQYIFIDRVTSNNTYHIFY